MNVKPKQNWVLIAFIIGISVLLGIPLPMKDKLECNLSNGDQYILENKYQYYLVADLFKFILWHAATRQNESGFKVYFKPKGALFKGDVVDTDSSFGAWELDDIVRMKSKCAEFVLIDDIYFSTSGMMLKKNNKLVPIKSSLYDHSPQFDYLSWEPTPKEEDELKQARAMDDAVNDEYHKNGPCCVASDRPRYATSHKTLQKILNQKAKQYGLYDGMSLNGSQWLGRIGNVFWEEVAFETVASNCSHDEATCPITAVWQAQSSDNGKTWSRPIITKDAKLFAIGKSILDQPAVAKPGKWSKGPG